jgi:hypothetical protein
MIRNIENKIQILRENYFPVENKLNLPFYEWVCSRYESDSNFFTWLFEEDLGDFGSHMTEPRKQDYTNFLMYILQNEMYKVLQDGSAKHLTLGLYKSLKGKTIKTIYIGYAGQDGVDKFTVGDLKSEYEIAEGEKVEKFINRAEYWKSYMTEKQLNEKRTTYRLFTVEGRNTFISVDQEYKPYFNEPTFTYSDTDRAVYFIEVTEKGSVV